MRPCTTALLLALAILAGCGEESPVAAPPPSGTRFDEVVAGADPAAPASHPAPPPTPVAGPD